MDRRSKIGDGGVPWLHPHSKIWSLQWQKWKSYQGAISNHSLFSICFPFFMEVRRSTYHSKHTFGTTAHISGNTNIIHSAHFNPVKFERVIHEISAHVPAKGNVNMHLFYSTCTSKTLQKLMVVGICTGKNMCTKMIICALYKSNNNIMHIYLAK